MSDEAAFNTLVLPRLRRHDEALMGEYIAAVSENTDRDIEASLQLFCKGLPRRDPGQTGGAGFDAFLVVPVHYDNIHDARVDRGNPIAERFGIDVNQDYAAFIRQLAKGYERLFGP